MKEGRACLLVFLLGLLFSFLPALLHGQQSFRITEAELTRLEVISGTLETNRQNWQSQASALKGQAVILNQQLRQGREILRNLSISFEEYAKDQSRKAGVYETRIAELTESVASAQLAKAKADSMTLKVSIVAIILGFVIAAMVAIKIKPP